MAEQLLGFLQEQWYVVVIAIVVMFVVARLIKKAIKWAIIIAIILVVLVYGFNYDLSDLPDVQQYLN